MDRAIHGMITTQEGLDANEVGFQLWGHSKVTPTFWLPLENNPVSPEA